jgi:hypothetical protein
MSAYQPDPSAYSINVVIAAYATAFVTVAVLVFIYYYAGHLLAISNRWLKSLALAALLLEVKGDFFRQPVMDFILAVSLGVDSPINLVILNQADKWVSGFLLAMSLVFLCPTKQNSTTSG